MLAPLPVTVALSGAGPALALTRFTDVDIDTDIFIPADCAILEGPTDNNGIPIPYQVAQKTSRGLCTIAGMPVFNGPVVSIEKEVSHDHSALRVQLMSAAKPLVDCGAPKGFAAPAGSLLNFATALFTVQYKVPVVGDAVATIPQTNPLQANSTEPVWSIIENIAHQVGAWMWCDETGTVHVESLKKYYGTPPVGVLTYSPGGNPANNIQKYKLRDNAGERFSQIVVIPKNYQKAKDGNAGTGLLSAVSVPGIMVDADMTARGYMRPLVIEDKRSKTFQQAQGRAMHEMALQKVKGTSIEIEVAGWLNPSMKPWQILQTVTVAIFPEAIHLPYLIAGRRFVRNFQEGTKTILTLISALPQDQL